MSDKCSHPCKIIDVLEDVCDGSIFNALVEGLVIDLPTGVVIDRLSDVMVNVGVGMLTDEVIIVVTATVFDLEFIVLLSYTGDVLADTVMNVDVSLDVLVEALPGALANSKTFVVTGICADLLDGVSTDVLLVVMPVLKFIIMPTSLEDALIFC